MKKIFLTLLLLIPTLFASAQGPIKSWNDQLDDFIDAFNQVDPTLKQLYSDNGVDAYVFTYFDPESGNVVMEGTISDDNGLNNVTDDLMSQAKSKVVSHLGNSAKKSTRINSIVNEFDKRNTNIVLLYSTPRGAKKQISVTPSEIKAAK